MRSAGPQRYRACSKLCAGMYAGWQEPRSWVIATPCIQTNNPSTQLDAYPVAIHAVARPTGVPIPYVCWVSGTRATPASLPPTHMCPSALAKKSSDFLFAYHQQAHQQATPHMHRSNANAPQSDLVAVAVDALQRTPNALAGMPSDPRPRTQQTPNIRTPCNTPNPTLTRGRALQVPSGPKT